MVFNVSCIETWPWLLSWTLALRHLFKTNQEWQYDRFVFFIFRLHFGIYGLIQVLVHSFIRISSVARVAEGKWNECILTVWLLFNVSLRYSAVATDHWETLSHCNMWSWHCICVVHQSRQAWMKPAFWLVHWGSEAHVGFSVNLSSSFILTCNISLPV